MLKNLGSAAKEEELPTANFLHSSQNLKFERVFLRKVSKKVNKSNI